MKLRQMNWGRYREPRQMQTQWPWFPETSLSFLSPISFAGRPNVGTYLSSVAAVYNYYFNRRCAVLMSANHKADGVENKAFSAIPLVGSPPLLSGKRSEMWHTTGATESIPWHSLIGHCTKVWHSALECCQDDLFRDNELGTEPVMISYQLVQVQLLLIGFKFSSSSHNLINGCWNQLSAWHSMYLCN